MERSRQAWCKSNGWQFDILIKRQHEDWGGKRDRGVEIEGVPMSDRETEKKQRVSLLWAFETSVFSHSQWSAFSNNCQCALHPTGHRSAFLGGLLPPWATSWDTYISSSFLLGLMQAQKPCLLTCPFWAPSSCWYLYLQSQTCTPVLRSQFCQPSGRPPANWDIQSQGPVTTREYQASQCQRQTDG